MKISVRDELNTIGAELRKRFLKVSLDFGAPMALWQMRQHLSADALAGLVVCVMAIPQAIAYAMIAGVQPTMGLYSLVIVSVVAGLWCYSSHLACGPTNASCVMLAAVLMAHQSSADVATSVALIALVVGTFQVISSFLGVGGLTKYISRTVIVGYTTATSILILLNQVPNLLGIEAGKAQGLFAKVWASVAMMANADVYSVATAAATFVSMWVVARFLPSVPVGFAAIMGGGLYAWLMRALVPEIHVKLVEDVQLIPAGLPSLVWPRFDLDAIYDLAGPAVALGLLACIEVSTISKNLAMRTNQPSRPNQDIFGLGLGNFYGAFFGALPASGSFTRSEFGYRSGAKTRWGVVLSGVFAMGIILLARPLLEKIPIPSLAALIMWLSLKLVHPKHIRVSVFSTYSDALVFLTTFLAAMFLRLDSAVYLGVLVSMALFLQKASEPKLMEFEFDAEGRFRQSQREGKERKPEISIVHVEGELFFGAAESVQEEIWRTVDSKNTKVVILRLRNAQNLDATGVMVLEQLLMDLRRMGVHLLVSGTSPSLDRVMARSGLDAVIGAENYFPSQNNFLDATRRAVKRANELVGVSDPQVRLYYDKDKSKETV